jgi:hypothetical protein
MWLFPFKTYYLATSFDRNQIYAALLNLTYLSDATYKKTDQVKKYFYGELSKEDFEFQSIADEKRLVPFVEGTIRGAGNEMYLFMNFKAFRMRRIYLIFFAFIAGCGGYALFDLLRFGTAVFQNPPFFLLLAVSLGLSIFLIIRCRNFWRVQKNSLDFFRGLLDAEIIAYRDVPVVFKL